MYLKYPDSSRQVEKLNHPEIRFGESFLTNCHINDLPKLQEKYGSCIRVGKIAYDRFNHELDKHVPIFLFDAMMDKVKQIWKKDNEDFLRRLDDNKKVKNYLIGSKNG